MPKKLMFNPDNLYYPHSKIMTERGLSLEEYTEFIKAYRDDCRFVYRESLDARVEIYYIPANKEITFISMPDNCVYQTSGNNIDGFIITVWRKNDDWKKELCRYWLF